MSENKHTRYDLAQMQSLPLEAKILMTQERIRQWYEYWNGMVYVSFSGGKDSTVLKHIVDSMYDDVPALFVDTGLEYPEIRKFVNQVRTCNRGGMRISTTTCRSCGLTCGLMRC